MDPLLKTCRRCDKGKSVDEFYDSPRNKDGKATICKECIRDVDKKNRAEKKLNKSKEEEKDKSVRSREKYPKDNKFLSYYQF